MSGRGACQTRLQSRLPQAGPRDLEPSCRDPSKVTHEGWACSHWQLCNRRDHVHKPHTVIINPRRRPNPDHNPVPGPCPRAESKGVVRTAGEASVLGTSARAPGPATQAAPAQVSPLISVPARDPGDTCLHCCSNLGCLPDAGVI